MSYYGQVFEDPEYYDELPSNPEQPYDDNDELQDASDWFSTVEKYSPFETINS